MNKSELPDCLQDEHRLWEELPEPIGLVRMDQAEMNRDGSMNDIVAHLTALS
jgi:hypothetical protein